jgi:hypothetical protein
MLSRANNTKCVRSALARSNQTNTSACTRNVVTSACTRRQYEDMDEEHSDEYIVRAHTQDTRPNKDPTQEPSFFSNPKPTQPNRSRASHIQKISRCSGYLLLMATKYDIFFRETSPFTSKAHP